MNSGPITPEFLLGIGFRQDGDDAGNKEYGQRVWSVSHVGDDDTDNMIQVVVSAKDFSIWLEVYDTSGDTLALIELPGDTKADVVSLCESLGMPMEPSKSDSCPHAMPFMYCDGCKADPCPLGLQASSTTAPL